MELKLGRDEIISQKAKLEKLNDEKNTFLGIAAHDLKNPLSGILGLVDILQLLHPTQTGNNEEFINEAKEILPDIKSAATRMQDIVFSLLNIQHITDGHISLYLKEISILKVINNVIPVNKHHAKTKGIEIEVLGDDFLITVDKSRLEEVMDNLISNAVKYSPYNCKVMIKIENSGDDFIFSVIDQGPGLSEWDLKNVFGRFKKLTARPTGNESSTGLGLYIVKTIVEFVNGEVRVENTPTGGAAFSIKIPKIWES